jgi:hypothetical protein
VFNDALAVALAEEKPLLSESQGVETVAVLALESTAAILLRQTYFFLARV